MKTHKKREVFHFSKREFRVKQQSSQSSSSTQSPIVKQMYVKEGVCTYISMTGKSITTLLSVQLYRGCGVSPRTAICDVTFSQRQLGLLGFDSTVEHTASVN